MSKHSELSYWTAVSEGHDLVEQSLGQLLAETAMTAPERLAVEYLEPEAVRWSWAQVYERASALAHGLLSCGLRPGEHLAVWAPNVPEWITLQWGAALAGLVLVTVNPAYRDAELAYVLHQSDARALFFEDQGAARSMILDSAFRRGLPALQKVFTMAEIPTLFGQGLAHELPQPAPTDVCMIQYTSGTTGFPKGALLTHRGVLNNARGISYRRGDRVGDSLVHGMPFFHAGGCIAHTVLSAVIRGVQYPVQKFDPLRVLRLLADKRASHFLAVPTMLQMVLDHPQLKEHDLSALRDVTVGGAPVPIDLAERCMRELGCQFTIVFGQTEASPIITQTRPTDPAEQIAKTVGVPLPHLDVRIADPAAGGTVPTGAVGEICVRGYSVMAGYYRCAESPVDGQGWLHTGDLGRMDAQGYVNVVGRIKDMVIRGGENIYPAEIENVLRRHPAVQDAYVVGVPDLHYGEELCAAVLSRTDVTAAALKEFVMQHLARYKVPRYVCFLSVFPMTTSGKVQKYVLRTQLTQRLGLQDIQRPTA
jgi:fatty-acyl-CoA synthase